MPDLRPMLFGEILDGTFNIYRRHFGLFMKLSAAVMGIPTLFLVYLGVRYGGANSLETLAAFEDHPLMIVGWGLGFLVVLTAAGLMLKAGTIRVISDSYLGQEPELLPALRLGAAKIVPLFLVAIAKWLLFLVVYLLGALVLGVGSMIVRGAGGVVLGSFWFFGFVGLCWLLVFVACGYGVTTPTLVLEDLPGSFECFGRSWELTRSFRLKVLGVYLVAWVIAVAVPFVANFTLSATVLQTAPVLQPVLVAFSSLLGILLAPVIPCALTMIYYDLRVRREAFDLQVLSQQLGIS